jgi:hypothetical protein
VSLWAGSVCFCSFLRRGGNSTKMLNIKNNLEIVCKFKNRLYICIRNLKQSNMKPYEQLRKAEQIVNDKTALVSYDNHGLTITFSYAPSRKEEIKSKAEALKAVFENVIVKGNKWFKIEVITR